MFIVPYPVANYGVVILLVDSLSIQSWVGPYKGILDFKFSNHEILALLEIQLARREGRELLGTY